MTNTPASDSRQTIDIIKRFPIVEELHQTTLPKEKLERRLDVSSTTFYRYTNWLGNKGLIEESNEGITLTSTGEKIAEEIFQFKTTILTTLQLSEMDRDFLLDVIRHAPGLEALGQGPRDRRELERYLDVSKTTSYRVTRTLEDLGLIEKFEGRYALTDAGEELRKAVDTFEMNVQTALRLRPVVEAVRDTTPAFDLEVLADATVTTSEHGDVHSPVSRFIALVEETGSLRGIDMNAIAPLYIGDIRQRIVEGMEMVDVMKPSVVANFLLELPDECIRACSSGNTTIYLHDDPPCGLAILDDRVMIGVRDGESKMQQMVVDTDSPKAREWAEFLFESYKAEAVRMEGFSPWEFRRAVERGSLNIDPLDH